MDKSNGSWHEVYTEWYVCKGCNKRVITDESNTDLSGFGMPRFKWCPNCGIALHWED